MHPASCEFGVQTLAEISSCAHRRRMGVLASVASVFLVGKPGSSKTLTLQIIANNLNGEQSQNKFWRRFPSIHIIQFQCSPLSTAAAITTQFQMACSFQANAENTICVLLLDEVGLAEHSPDMPLKALHAILVDPPVAVVVSSLLCISLLPVLFLLL
jgi:hypothetical protein